VGEDDMMHQKEDSNIPATVPKENSIDEMSGKEFNRRMVLWLIPPKHRQLNEIRKQHMI
jgi:hypothetical protein